MRLPPASADHHGIIGGIVGLSRFPSRKGLWSGPRPPQPSRHTAPLPSSPPSRERRAQDSATAAPQPPPRPGSFSEHHLDAEPHRSDESGDDHGNHGFEGITPVSYTHLRAHET